MLKYDKKWKLKFVCILNFSYFFLFHGQHRPLQLVLHNSPLPSTCSCITYLPSPTPTRSLLSLDNTLISSPLLNSFFFLRLPSLLLLFTPPSLLLFTLLLPSLLFTLPPQIKIQSLCLRL